MPRFLQIGLQGISLQNGTIVNAGMESDDAYFHFVIASTFLIPIDISTVLSQLCIKLHIKPNSFITAVVNTFLPLAFRNNELRNNPLSEKRSSSR